MSILRSSRMLALLVLLVAAIAACGGAANSPGTSASVPAGSTPVPASQPAEPTPSSGGGDGTTVSIPPILDATYTSGKFHAEVTGDVTVTIDVPLQGGFSFTSGGSTVLGYADTNSANGGGVVLGPDVLGVTISATSISTAGSNADANHCDVTVTQSDASRLAGTFDCKRLIGVVPSTSKTVTVDVKGSFEASR